MILFLIHKVDGKQDKFHNPINSAKTYSISEEGESTSVSSVTESPGPVQPDTDNRPKITPEPPAELITTVGLVGLLPVTMEACNLTS
ncbi:hypothetical protein KTT_25900 [Tengunoibacter tsumagoiensis]|uniref:Uncharacterized protein n=1 Tax=Tengunoibacter tsumagoiensis TaxID=2014871 RepID=A0A402A140_9CHLR|nr:hypothetical protein KTT_25900 [Tengunoibacter tsumagoiensis]